MNVMFLVQARLIQKTRKLGSFKVDMKNGEEKEKLLKGDPTILAFFSAPNYHIKIYWFVIK